MAKPNFFIVAGNTAPAYAITCLRAGTAIDLTGATVDVLIYNNATKLQTNSGHTTASITSPSTSGVISYSAQANDFPSKGLYTADVKVTYNGGSIEILYNQARWKVRNTGVS